MKNFIQNKKLLLAIGCGLLAVIILVAVLATACVDDDKNVTEPTGVASEVVDGVATTPSNVTEPNVTEPSDITEPQEPTEPEKPAEPRDPSEVTVGTIRATDWDSWDKAKRQAFLDSVDWNNITPEEQHNFIKAVDYDDYDCGFEGHACRGQEGHDALMAKINAGCTQCGKTDCPSLLAVNPEDLFTWPVPSQCPEYDITKDPLQYCQSCGLPTRGEPGEKCVIHQTDSTCHYCGAWITAWTCHCCDPDDLD